MGVETFGRSQHIEMTAEECDAFLRSQGFGILSLASDGEAYGLPISFGYDGARLYFVLLRPGTESKKETFIRATETASFLAFDVADKHHWQSVIVTGQLTPVDDESWPALRDAIEDNAWFPSLFSETEPMQDLLGWRLDPESITGQQSHGLR